MRKNLFLNVVLIMFLIVGTTTLRAQTSIDPSSWTQTFNDDFNSLDISSNGTTTWKSQLPYGGQFGCPVSQSNITVSGGILTMKASFTGSDKCDSWGSWTGSLMCTLNSSDQGFSQQYGYFEVSAKMPTGGEGIWAAPLWLLTDDAREGFYNGTSYGEIDVNEYYGNQPGTYYTTLHQWNPHEGYGSTPNICDGGSCLSDEFHSYGVLVTPSVMTFYFDRNEVWSTPTTEVCKEPIYPLINLVVGAGWSTCNLPNDLYMYVDYMKVWALPSTGNPPTSSITSPANGATYTVGDDIVINVDVADSDGSISKVDFYAGTNIIGTNSTSPYSFTWSNVANGNYELTAVAYDNDGNVTGSAPVDVTVGLGTGSFRIRNRWKTEQYLYQDGDQVKYGTPLESDLTSQWTLTSTGDGYYYISNVSTGDRINIENALDYLECTAMWDGAWSAEWRLDNIGDGSGFQMIGIRWNNNEFINIEQLLGYAQCNTPPGGGAYSAQWIFEPVGGGGGSAPAAPSGVAAVAGSEQVTLSWNTTSGATSYSVYRGTSPGGESSTAIATGVTMTNYTDAGLTNQTTYYYKIKATNTYGTSAYSDEVSATPAAGVLAAPTGLSATGGNAQVELAWTSSAGATSYSVYRGTTAGGESTTAIATGVSSTNYTDTGVTNGTTYYYKVNASDGTKTSGYSNEASATPNGGSGSTSASIGIDFSGAGTPVSAGTLAGVVPQTNWNNLSSASGSISSVKDNNGTTISGLSADWGSNGSNTLYALGSNFSGTNSGGNTNLYSSSLITYGTAGSGWQGHITLTGIPYSSYDVYAYFEGPGNGYVNINGNPNGSTFTGGTTFSFSSANVTNFVAATGAGGPANYALVTDVSGSILTIYHQGGSNGGLVGIQIVEKASSAPSAPSGLSATGGDGEVALTWSSSVGASSYNVYRGTSVGGESTTAIATGVTSTSYIDTGLSNNTTYYYKVKAVNANGVSGYSNETSATPTSASGSASIGIDFSGAGTPVPAGMLAGVVPQTNWNNLSTSSGSLSSVKDNNGSTVSGLSASWGSNGSNTLYALSSNFSGTNASGNADLYSSSLITYGTAGNGWQGHITLTGIPYSNYDVYAYFEGPGNGYVNINGSPNGSTFTGGTTYSFSSADVANFVEASGSGGAANYALVSDVGGSSLTVYHQGGSNGGLVGIQIVQSTGLKSAKVSTSSTEIAGDNKLLHVAYLRDQSVRVLVDFKEAYTLKLINLNGTVIKAINANESNSYIFTKQEFKEGMYVVTVVGESGIASEKIFIY